MREDREQSPCLFGEIIPGWTCECFHPDTNANCPIWLKHGHNDVKFWDKKNCKHFLPSFYKDL